MDSVSKLKSVEIYQDQALGVGAYGKVYKAKYGQLPCAAKLLHDTMFEDGDPGRVMFAKSFEKECQFLSQIKHPNIVQFLGTCIDPQSKRLALVMELMEQCLTKFLERSTGPLSYHIQLNICHDVALALSYLHSNAIIHRDLSSNNVLLFSENSRAKVSDFGMSKLIDMKSRMTMTTICPGTEAYMPPEALIKPPHYSYKLDCFSYGVLSIQIDTKKFPQPGDAHQRIKDPQHSNRHLFCQIPETERRKNHINLVESGHPLLPTTLRCLADSESDRPTSDEICAALAELKMDRKYIESVEKVRNQALLAMKLHEEVLQNEEVIQKARTEHQNQIAAKDKDMEKERADHINEMATKNEIIEQLVRQQMLLADERPMVARRNTIVLGGRGLANEVSMLAGMGLAKMCLYPYLLH